MRELLSVNKADRATVRTCLIEALLALSEARENLAWWETLGSGVRRQYQEFEALAGSLQRCLEE